VCATVEEQVLQARVQQAKKRLLHRKSESFRNSEKLFLIRIKIEPLFRVNPEIHVQLMTIVKMTDGLGIALLAVELGIHFVVDVGREFGKMIGPIRTDNVALDCLGASVGEVHHGIRQWVVLLVDHLAGQSAAGIGFLIGGINAVGNHGKTSQKQQDRHNAMVFQVFSGTS